MIDIPFVEVALVLPFLIGPATFLDTFVPNFAGVVLSLKVDAAQVKSLSLLVLLEHVYKWCQNQRYL